jgi:hypothetical protein
MILPFIRETEKAATLIKPTRDGGFFLNNICLPSFCNELKTCNSKNPIIKKMNSTHALIKKIISDDFIVNV